VDCIDLNGIANLGCAWLKDENRFISIGPNRTPITETRIRPLGINQPAPLTEILKATHLEGHHGSRDPTKASITGLVLNTESGPSLTKTRARLARERLVDTRKLKIDTVLSLDTFIELNGTNAHTAFVGSLIGLLLLLSAALAILISSFPPLSTPALTLLAGRLFVR